MKKILNVVLLVFGMSILFTSCEGLEGTGVNSWIVGDWIMIEDNGEAYSPYEYLRFTRDGYFAVVFGYRGNKKNCWFDNGTLYSTPEVEWDTEIEAEYKIDNGNLITAGIVIGKGEKINKDKFYFDAYNDYEGTYVRIKNFKTQERQ